MSTIHVFPLQINQAIAALEGAMAKLVPAVPETMELGICSFGEKQHCRAFLAPPLDAGPAFGGFLSVSLVHTPSDTKEFSCYMSLKDLKAYLARLPEHGGNLSITNNGDGEAGVAMACGDVIDTVPGGELPEDMTWITFPANYRSPAFEYLAAAGDTGVHYWWGFDANNSTGPTVAFKVPRPEDLPAAMEAIFKRKFLKAQPAPAASGLTVAERMANAPSAPNPEPDKPVQEESPVVIPVVPAMGAVSEQSDEEAQPPPVPDPAPAAPPVPVTPAPAAAPTAGTPPEAPVGKRKRRTAEQMEADKKAETLKMVETLKGLGYVVESPEEKAAAQPVAKTPPPEFTVKDRLAGIGQACALIMKQVEELGKAVPPAKPDAKELLKKLDLNALVLKSLEAQGVTAGEK